MPPAEQSLQVNPNPGDGLINVSFSNPQRGPLTLGLRNLSGVEVSRKPHIKTGDLFQQTLDLRSLPGGTYFVEVQIGEATYRKRIIKH